MEAADCLYGVSMKPGGSSRVVSEKVAETMGSETTGAEPATAADADTVVDVTDAATAAATAPAG